MTDKRGTGAEYGQEILRERSAEASAPEPTKKASKKTVLSVIVAAIIAGGAMTAVILTSDKTPAEKVESLAVDISSDGVALTEKVKADIDSIKTPPTDPVQPVTESEQAKVESEPAAPALEVSPLKQEASPVVEPVADESNSVTPTTDVKPSEEVVSKSQAVDETVRTEREYDPAKFGITADQSQDAETPPSKGGDTEKPQVAESVPVTPTPTVAVPAAKAPVQAELPAPVPEPIRQERVELPAINQFAQTPQMTGSDLNYTGSALKVEYKAQQQDTIYLYSTFAAKIFLLPTDKGDEISAYLSDEKGWQLKLLPGGILRVQRSDNKASWSQATDLFIVAGKRTYSLILQGVGEPSERTDSLRYITAEPEQKPKSKK